MIEHPTWRSLIYRLAEEYPDCLMLNFTIKVFFWLYSLNRAIFTNRWFKISNLTASDLSGFLDDWLPEPIALKVEQFFFFFNSEKQNSADLTFFWFQLISDAGFQGEITSISTAAQQIEVFSRVLKTAISGFLTTSDDWQKSIEECAVSINGIYALYSELGIGWP